MKRIFALTFVSLLLGASVVTHAADAPPPKPDSPSAKHKQPEAEDVTFQNTRSVIVLEMDGTADGFIFVSKTGATLAEKAADCGKDPSCVSLLRQLHEAHKVNTVVLQVPKGKGIPEKQPDQPL